MTAKREAVEALGTAKNVEKMAENSDAVPTKVPTIRDATKIHYV